MAAGTRYDAIVVGGGHNGLVAATYLGQAGKRVLVLERRSTVGGAAATEEIAPGFRCPTGAALCGLLRREIVDDLRLAGHGFSLLPVDPTSVLLGGPRPLRLWRDEAKSQSEIATFSGADAAAYPKFRSLMIRIARVIDPLFLSIPPSVETPTLGEEFFLFRRALRLRRLGKNVMYEAMRLPFMSLHAVLGEWFESEPLKASLALDGLFGVFRGPWSPYTAFGLFHHYLAEVDGGSWAFVRGGTGALPAALASAARAAGVTIRTDAEVRRILSPDGRAGAVELADGERIEASAILSNADPKRTFLRLVEPVDLGADFLLRVRNYSSDGCVSKVNLALDGVPRFPALDGFAPPHFQVAPDLEYIERAYDDAKHGGVSASPTLDVTIPSVADPSLAPSGKHVLSAVVQYTPYRLRNGAWADQKEPLRERVLEILSTHIPNLRSLVTAAEVLTPPDLEARFGLSGGHMHHGEMTLHQQYVLRPVPGWGRYRTPIPGLYLCGSGAHPGGGLTGAPGYNAARAVLEDWPALTARA